MKTKDFYYDLPEELIAQRPLTERTDSRLMVLHKQTGTLEHRHFYNIGEYLKPGDCLVLNNSRVIPARLKNERLELFLLKPLGDNRWEALVKPGRRAKPGHTAVFGGGRLEARVDEVTETGNRIVTLFYDGDFDTVLDEVGRTPLPPYIKQVPNDTDKERYQTVYAKHKGSVAAPTAGLHFNDRLLTELQCKGIKLAYVTLHVGLGTFKPVKAEDISEHHMHEESFSIDSEAADTINNAKANGNRVIAVGTTSCRVLESAADEEGKVGAMSGSTDIFIFPGYTFKVIDGLVTNFHLPESTLIMLVSALAGRDAVLNAYAEAVKERYRFFSYGDGMVIV